jgi:hypothetical protein
VELRVLTRAEAWELQDALLVSPLMEVEVPEHLQPQAAKLNFSLAVPANLLAL